MTFTVETGQGVALANSYVTAAEATAYLTDYEPALVDQWPTVQSEQEAALIVGCQAIEMHFRDKFLSMRRIPVSNSLSWPRFPFYDRFGVLQNDRVIPDTLKNAQATMALYYILGNDMFPQIARDSSVASESVKIGDLSITTSYSKDTHYDPFRKVTLLLWNIIRQDRATTMLR